MTERTRNSGDIYKVLHPTVQQHGRSFIKYDECKVVTKATLSVKAIEAPGAIAAFSAIKKAYGNKSFTRSDVKAGMKKLFKEFYGEFKMKKEHRTEWVDTMTRRLCNMQRHINQALAKIPPPKWARKLPVPHQTIR